MSLAVAVSDVAYAEAGTKREHSPRSKTPRWLVRDFRLVLGATPEDVLQPRRGSRHEGVSAASRQRWRWIDLAQRLTWELGADEALLRLTLTA